MAVSICFDQWQKDVFFSAAEEIQESADKLESVNRLWMRERSAGLISDLSDELGRQLHMALGTAKWQLEEFERAVKLSHEGRPSDESTIVRHSQFVDAIGTQISSVEKALQGFFIDKGKQPFRWVQLGEEDRDDLESFLSRTPENLQEPCDRYANGDVDSLQAGSLSKGMSGLKESVIHNSDANNVVGLEAKKLSKPKNEVDSQAEQINGQGRAWSSPNIGAWEVMISNEDIIKKKALETRTEASGHILNLSCILRNVKFIPKSTWLRNSFRKAKSGEYLQKQGTSSFLHLKGVPRSAQGVSMLCGRSKTYNCNNRDDSKISHAQQLFMRVSGIQQKAQNSKFCMQFSRSVWFTFLFMVSILLIGLRIEEWNIKVTELSFSLDRETRRNNFHFTFCVVFCLKELDDGVYQIERVKVFCEVGKSNFLLDNITEGTNSTISVYRR